MAYSASFNSIAPGFPAWDDASVLINTSTSGANTSQDDYNLNVPEGIYNFLFYCLFFTVTLNFNDVSVL